MTLINATQEHLDKIEARIDIPNDNLTSMADVAGKVVIFQNGEIFGDVSLLSFERDNSLLEQFPDEQFEKVLVP